jgi:hypothetical protein
MKAAVAVLAVAVAALLAGCRSAAPRAVRHIGEEVTGALTVETLREVYHTPAFVVRDVVGGKYVAVQDSEMAPESRIDDTNLLIWAEGSADTVDGFRWTARLLAESPYGFPQHAERLVIVCLKWSHGINPVVEHLNRAAQEAGAAVLADMLEIHRRRHGDDGHVSLAGFSAGTRVIERAFWGTATKAEPWHPDAFARVDNVVFVGSSVGLEEATPYESIRGRFLNFVNPRDTHFGDRAAYVAPAGEAANPLKLLQQATIERRPRFGASVAGFRILPLLTAPEQFDAVDALVRDHHEAAARAFKMVNVPVPPTLVPYNVFGTPLLNDDLDDYVNLAPNHYVMVGRGPGGRTDMPDFRQYRAAAEEFVRDLVAAAILHGRLYRFDLKNLPQGASPIGLPILVPWAIFKGNTTPEAPDAPAGAGGAKEPNGKAPADPGKSPAPQ